MNVDEKTRNKKFFFVEFPGKIHDAMCATIIRTCRKIRNLYHLHAIIPHWHIVKLD